MPSVVKWSHYALLAGFSAVMPVAAFAQTEAEPDVATAVTDERVVLEADIVYENSDDNTIIAEGNVEALYQGRVLRADRVIFDRTSERARASGNVVMIEADGSQQFADEIDVGPNLSDGFAIGYSARLPGDATVAAKSAIRRSDGINAMEHVVYTACPICEDGKAPTWTIRARRAVLDEESQMISYRDAVVEIAGIPVFYLPYLSHPDPNSERRSGLLMPKPGLSSKLGPFYQQPYYWAVSDYSDVTISPMVSQNVNPLIGLDFRKRFYSGAVKFETSFTHEADFNSNGETFGEETFRGHLFGNGLFAISPEWKWGFGVETQTDDLYDRRYDISGQGDKRGLYSNQPRRLLSQLFVTGQGDSYYTDAALLNFQGLRGEDDAARLPLVSPLAYADKYWDLGAYGFASVNASSAILTRDVGADSHRVSLGGDWNTMKILPGGFTFEPFAELRGDYYMLDKAVSGKDSVARGVGSAGTKIAYPMVRPGANLDIMLEPAVMAAWGFSNVNDPAIPVEDSLLYEFDETSLYEANGFSNFDLYEGDGKLSAGLTARAIWKNGTEIATTVGRRWRSRADPRFDVASNLDGKSSDWIAAASFKMGRSLELSSRVRLNEDDLSLSRFDMRASTSFNRFRAVGQYYKIDERISPAGTSDEGVYLRGEAQITDRYSVVFGQLRDISRNVNTKQELGIAYTDDCSRFEFLYARSELRDRTLGPSESFLVRFSLLSLGNFGSDSFD
ncbi:MAG: LPS-assembly protein LptD [Alphaproteobacteria bacterium HGW-Alphaproteobacteria-18]|nr:MAG: LPS-assembly protein LptD [Alphaproteobacteria bacterium HGW-Alphaproteobacteria-18]